MAAGSSLPNSNWRQGSTLKRELLNDPSILPDDLKPADRLIIISQDCDIVHRSYKAEPFVEFLVARAVNKSDGRMTNGKNPRTLCFNAKVNDVEQIFQLSINDKYRVERQILEAGTPDNSVTIPRKTVKTIAKWAAKRYVRASFPTAFNNRLTEEAKELIESSMSTYGLDVRGTFIAFVGSDQELDEDETYSIIVRIVAPVEAVEDRQREEVLIKLQSALQNAFGMCAGIEVLEMRVDSEAEFSLDDYDNSRLWDYEFVSVVEDDPNCSMTGI